MNLAFSMFGLWQFFLTLVGIICFHPLEIYRNIQAREIHYSFLCSPTFLPLFSTRFIGIYTLFLQLFKHFLVLCKRFLSLLNKIDVPNITCIYTKFMCFINSCVIYNRINQGTKIFKNFNCSIEINVSLWTLSLG